MRNRQEHGVLVIMSDFSFSNLFGCFIFEPHIMYGTYYVKNS